MFEIFAWQMREGKKEIIFLCVGLQFFYCNVAFFCLAKLGTTKFILKLNMSIEY